MRGRSKRNSTQKKIHKDSTRNCLNEDSESKKNSTRNCLNEKVFTCLNEPRQNSTRIPIKDSTKIE